MALQQGTIDAYIAGFPTAVQRRLRNIRRAIQRSAPTAEESIRYRIPAFGLNGRYVVYFAGWKHHIGLYPVPAFDDALEREVAKYRAAKDTLRFPHAEALPSDLITRVVARLVARRAAGPS